MQSGFSEFLIKYLLKRNKNMLLTLLLPLGMKTTTFRGTWIAYWCSWWRYKRFHHIVPSVWTPCCAMQPPGAASWLSLHPKSPHALSLGSLLSLVLWSNRIAVFKVKATAKYQNVSDCLSRWCLLKCWTLYYQTCYSYASLWAKLSYKKCLFAVFKAMVTVKDMSPKMSL